MSANSKDQPGGQKASRGQILVIISSEHTLTLQNGKTYPTGYFLNELTVPVLLPLGPVMSNLRGNSRKTGFMQIIT